MFQKLKEFILITIATLIVSAGTYYFKFPNNFSTGGVTGISIVLGHLVEGITPGTFVLILNVLFLIIGFFFLNRSFGLKTIYCSLLMSLSIRLFEIFLPLNAPLTNQKFLELCFSVLFPAFGSAILFNMNASTGGTDIVAMILKKYTSLDIGKALFCSDFIIVCLTIFVFGVETFLFSMFGLMIRTFLVDSVIENINLKKNFIIVTTHPKEINDFITEKLHRSGTFWESKGAFTDDKRYMIMVVLNRPQAKELRAFVKKVDKHAFVVINNTSNIIGKGFREI